MNAHNAWEIPYELYKSSEWVRAGNWFDFDENKKPFFF